MKEVVHGDKLVYVKFHKSGSRMFNREDVKKDNKGEYEYNKEEVDKLNEESKGFSLKVRADKELVETSKTLRKTLDAKPNREELRRSRRIRSKGQGWPSGAGRPRSHRTGTKP